jgi:hypothetical protein
MRTQIEWAGWAVLFVGSHGNPLEVLAAGTKQQENKQIPFNFIVLFF